MEEESVSAIRYQTVILIWIQTAFQSHVHISGGSSPEVISMILNRLYSKYTPKITLISASASRIPVRVWNISIAEHAKRTSIGAVCVICGEGDVLVWSCWIACMPTHMARESINGTLYQNQPVLPRPENAAFSAVILSKIMIFLAVFRYAVSTTDKTHGDWLISAQKTIFKYKVEGSGCLMLRVNARRITSRIWMQLGGMTSQKL